MKTTIAYGSVAFVADGPDQNARMAARDMVFTDPAERNTFLPAMMAVDGFAAAAGTSASRLPARSFGRSVLGTHRRIKKIRCRGNQMLCRALYTCVGVFVDVSMAKIDHFRIEKAKGHDGHRFDRRG